MLTANDIEDELQGLTDMIDSDDRTLNGLIEYCHRHQAEIAEWINEEYQE